MATIFSPTPPPAPLQFRVLAPTDEPEITMHGLFAIASLLLASVAAADPGVLIRKVDGDTSKISACQEDGVHYCELVSVDFSLLGQADPVTILGREFTPFYRDPKDRHFTAFRVRF